MKLPLTKVILLVSFFLSALVHVAADKGSIRTLNNGHGPSIKPAGILHGKTLLPPGRLKSKTAPQVDLDAVREEDAQRDMTKRAAPRYAIANPVSISIKDEGTEEMLDDGTKIVRFLVKSPSAKALTLGFRRFRMPASASLFLYDTRNKWSLGPYTQRKNHELWTQVLPGDSVIIELNIPAGVSTYGLECELGSIGVVYRGFGYGNNSGGKGGRELAGSCNMDVTCQEDNWQNEISSVGVISLGGTNQDDYTFCTGVMVNNVQQDGKPYFMTSEHCGIDSSNDFSLGIYWNWQAPSCGGDLLDGYPEDNPWDQYQSGSTHLVSSSASDFTLVELTSYPDLGWGITFAGWDARAASSTAQEAVCIHHPNTEEKKISFEYDPTATTNYFSKRTSQDGNYIRVKDWDVGTTEPGSSGSPLFDDKHHVIGLLSGGSAACGNSKSDWYGRFSSAWDSGLRGHLGDETNNIMFVDTLGGGGTGPCQADCSSGECGQSDGCGGTCSDAAVPCSSQKSCTGDDTCENKGTCSATCVAPPTCQNPSRCQRHRDCCSGFKCKGKQCS